MPLTYREHTKQWSRRISSIICIKLNQPKCTQWLQRWLWLIMKYVIYAISHPIEDKDKLQMLLRSTQPLFFSNIKWHPQIMVLQWSCDMKIEQWMYYESVNWWTLVEMLLKNIRLYSLGKQGFEFWCWRWRNSDLCYTD